MEGEATGREAEERGSEAGGTEKGEGGRGLEAEGRGLEAEERGLGAEEMGRAAGEMERAAGERGWGEEGLAASGELACREVEGFREVEQHGTENGWSFPFPHWQRSLCLHPKARPGLTGSGRTRYPQPCAASEGHGSP